jgi:hypothetical protein
MPHNISFQKYAIHNRRGGALLKRQRAGKQGGDTLNMEHNARFNHHSANKADSNTTKPTTNFCNGPFNKPFKLKLPGQRGKLVIPNQHMWPVQFLQWSGVWQRSRRAKTKLACQKPEFLCELSSAPVPPKRN